MTFTLIPKIFHADRQVGLDLFVDGPGFEVLYPVKGPGPCEGEGD